MRNLKMESMHQWLWRDFAGINELPERCQHAANPFSPRLFTGQRKDCPALFCPSLSPAFVPCLLAVPESRKSRFIHLKDPTLVPSPVDICQLGRLQHLCRNLSLKAAATWIKPPWAAEEGGGDATKDFRAGGRLAGRGRGSSCGFLSARFSG